MTLSESVKVDVENKMRLELNEASPDGTPVTAEFTVEQRQTIESRIAEKFDVQLAETYDRVVKKAEFLVKLEKSPVFQSMNPTE